jgi:hypothetical protein
MNIEELKTTKATYDAAMKEHGKQAVVEEVQRLFKVHADVRAIRWVQYTPYFNDGEPCVFSADVSGVMLDSDEGEIEDFEFEENYSHPMAKALGELTDTLDEVFEACFGESAQVTIYRDGKVEIEEYSHD